MKLTCLWIRLKTFLATFVLMFMWNGWLNQIIFLSIDMCRFNIIIVEQWLVQFAPLESVVVHEAGYLNTSSFLEFIFRRQLIPVGRFFMDWGGCYYY